MEKGEFRKLGERPYVIGFVKTYAKYLGLCEKNISEMVRKNHPEYEASKFQIYKPGQIKDWLSLSSNSVDTPHITPHFHLIAVAR